MTDMKRYSRTFFLLTLLLSALVLLAACQDENGDDIDEPADTTEEATDAPAAPDPTNTAPVEEPAEEATEPAAPAPTAPAETPAETAPAPAETGEAETNGDTDETETSTVLVYLVKNEEIGVASREIAGTPQVATGAINELLSGTTPYEQDLGFSSAIPEGTRLLGIDIQDDGTAVIDLTGEFEAGGGSASMLLRTAQIVFTLTQFSTVDQVRFHIDGVAVDSLGGEGLMVDRPLNRGDFEDQSPAILVESPTPGQVVSSPINLRGTSNTFEANMQFEVIDVEGDVIYSDFGTATSGTGTRGTFNFNLDVPVDTEGLGTIVVFETSAKDGSRINVIEIPVDLRR